MLDRSSYDRIAACLFGLALTFSVATQAKERAKNPSGAAAQVVSISMSDGKAWVDDAALASEANLYPGERVRLDTNATAMLHIPGGFALVAAGTIFRVEPGGLWLEHGRLQLRQDSAAPFSIDGNLFRARFGASSAPEARAEFTATETGGRITSLAGVVELTAMGDLTPYRVHPGESALWGDQVARAAPTNSSAGEVTRLVSPVEMDRGTQQVAAALQSPVFWNDLLRSGRAGRARVSLNDGSILSLGSDSSLRVLQHDAAAQQTVLDLAAGRMRGQVMKLTRPGAKFEIRTPTAVAGLVGTDFYLYVTADFTELIVFDGVVRLTNTATGQAVNVSAGMKIVMRKSGQTDGPSPASTQEVAQAQSATNVPAAQQAQGFQRYGGIIVVAGEAGAVAALSLSLPSSAPVSPFTLSSPGGTKAGQSF